MFARIVTCEQRYENARNLRNTISKIKGIDDIKLFPCVFGKTDFWKNGGLSEMFLNLAKARRINTHVSLSMTELAISISHEKVLKEFLLSSNEYAIIFEDDCSMRPHMCTNLEIIVQKIISNPFRFGIIHLWNSNAANTLKHAKTTEHHFDLFKESDETEKVFLKKECRPHCPGTVAYIITRKCAERVIELNEKIRMPIDNLMGDALHRTREFELLTFDTQDMILDNPMYDNSTQSISDLFICNDSKITSEMKHRGFR